MLDRRVIDLQSERLERLSTDKIAKVPARFIRPYEQAVNLCTICGVVEPKAVGDGYVPRECEHLRAARYAAQDMLAMQKEQAKTAAQLAEEASSNACYFWLGRDYSEDGLEQHSFATYKVTRDNQAAVVASLAFVDNPQGVLIFHGGVGRGKTHLACAIANALRAKGTPCTFTTGPNLFNAISDRLEANHGYQEFIKHMCSTPVLILDDIDKVPPTDFRKQTYFEVLNKRTNRKLPTIITTNVGITEKHAGQLSPFLGDAAASRLNIGLVLAGIRGSDYREGMIGE